MEYFHERLQYLANLKKIDQSSLSRETGQDSSVISLWWNGKRVPGPKNTRMLCKIFNCDYHWLKDGKGEPPPLEIIQALLFDPEILTDAITVVENKLRDSGLDMEPEVKAELITEIYMHISEDEKGDAKEKISRLLRLLLRK